MKLVRRIFTFACAVSLLLFLLTAAIWIRSYWIADHFWIMHRSGHAQLLRTASGSVSFKAQRAYFSPQQQAERRWIRCEHATTREHLHRSDLRRSYSSPYQWGPFGFARTARRPPPTAEEWEERHSDLESLRADLQALRTQGSLTPEDRNRAAELEVRATILLAPSTGFRWEVVFPAWLLLILFALMPSLWIVRRRRQRKMRKLGLCLQCGYDLRATPDRCPECGTVPDDRS